MNTTFARTPAVPIESLPGTLPHVKIPKDIDADAAINSCLDKLHALKAEHLYTDAFWRDLLAFTGTFRTFHSPPRILSAWNELSAHVQPTDFKLTPGSAHDVQAGPVGWIEARFTFKIAGKLPGKGSGIILIVPDEETKDWKIWLLSTILEEVDALGNPDVLEPISKSASNGTFVNGASPQDENVDCVIMGAGQNGLCLAGRLKALGVKAVALEKESHVGGNWTSRYDSVKLHTGKYYAHLPFGQTFQGEDYPYFLAAKDLARGFESYVDQYGLDVRLSTSVESAEWDVGSGLWTVHANQNGKRWSIKGRHIVFAIGAGGQIPKMPIIPNRDAYQGTVLHSKEYKTATQWNGKKGVVIGTANTAHDVAEDMLEADLSSVTMVQRNRTAVVPWNFFSRHHNILYNENSITPESDRKEFALPLPFYHGMANAFFKMAGTEEPEQFDALERAGFKTDRFPNLYKILKERQGGHYLDVGASQKIIDGLIKMKWGEIESYTPTGLRFTDGSTLDADLIVFCTGFEGNMRNLASSIVGPKVEEQLDDYWCVDKEGEVRGAFKPMGHPGIWYTGGDLALARFYSRFLAFQIKADLAGVPFEPYRRTP